MKSARILSCSWEEPLFVAGLSGLIAFLGSLVGEKVDSKLGAGKMVVVTFIVGAFPWLQ